MTFTTDRRGNHCDKSIGLLSTLKTAKLKEKRVKLEVKMFYQT